MHWHECGRQSSQRRTLSQDRLNSPIRNELMYAWFQYHYLPARMQKQEHVLSWLIHTRKSKKDYTCQLVSVETEVHSNLLVSYSSSGR